MELFHLKYSLRSKYGIAEEIDGMRQKFVLVDTPCPSGVDHLYEMERLISIQSFKYFFGGLLTRNALD
jgi:hypothetical protein